MASTHKRNDTWWVKFRFNGKQIFRSLKTNNARNAERLKYQIERTLADIDQGRITIPSEADLWQFVLSDGKLIFKPSVPSTPQTLRGLIDSYFAAQIGQKEANTLLTEQVHRRHLERVVGGEKAVASFCAADIQAYIKARTNEGVGRITIQKEVASLRMWLYRSSQLIDVKPADDLREMFRSLDFPKGREQPPFQTWSEIESQITRQKSNMKEQKALWDCLFLDTEQVTEFLDWADQKGARHPVPFFVPLLNAVAHTGARISELLRSQVSDWNFEAGVVALREKKKSKTKDTTRRVNLSDRLIRVMGEWFEKAHPGGRVSFCREPNVYLEGKNLRNVFDRFIGKHKWSDEPHGTVGDDTPPAYSMVGMVFEVPSF